MSKIFSGGDGQKHTFDELWCRWDKSNHQVDYHRFGFSSRGKIWRGRCGNKGHSSGDDQSSRKDTHAATVWQPYIYRRKEVNTERRKNMHNFVQISHQMGAGFLALSLQIILLTKEVKHSSAIHTAYTEQPILRPIQMVNHVFLLRYTKRPYFLWNQEEVKVQEQKWEKIGLLKHVAGRAMIQEFPSLRDE